MAFDPLGIRRRVEEQVAAALPARVEVALAAAKEEQRIHLLTDVLAELRANPDLLKQFAAESEAHQTEMAWRARQDFYDIAGTKSGFDITEAERQKHINRSRRHYLYDPLYIRAVNLTVDFIFGAGVAAPKPVKEGNADVQALIDLVWRDALNMRWLSGGTAQRERCKQLLIDGEVPWLVYLPGEDEHGYRFWPLDSLGITEVIEHPKMPGLALAYKRSWLRADGVTTESCWYWATDAHVVLESAEAGRELIPQTKLTATEWAGSELNETFDAGPWLLLWRVSHNPLGLRGHPPFFSALDWGEANVGLAGNLTTYIKHVTAITGVIRGRMTAGDISDLKSALKSTLSGTQPPPGTGTWRLEGEGQEFKMLNAPTGGGELFKTGFEVTRLMIAAACGMPVHWLGDPSTGNLATAEAMQLPQLRMFEAWQHYFIGQYDDIFRLCWRHQKSETGWDVTELIDIDFPALVNEDTSRMITALALARQAGMIAERDAALQVAQLLHVENIQAFADAVLAETSALGTDLSTLAESQPAKALAVFRRAMGAATKAGGA